eukprot:m.58086 g.58086  ORF g.58086 m.58086 type:complete len:149 (+) comp7851_c0_seq1:187-633(+)
MEKTTKIDLLNKVANLEEANKSLKEELELMRVAFELLENRVKELGEEESKKNNERVEEERKRHQAEAAKLEAAGKKKEEGVSSEDIVQKFNELDIKPFSPTKKASDKDIVEAKEEAEAAKKDATVTQKEVKDEKDCDHSEEVKGESES